METLTLDRVVTRGDGMNIHIDFSITNESLPNDRWGYGCDTTFTAGNIDAAVATCEVAARAALLAAVNVAYPSQYQ